MPNFRVVLGPDKVNAKLLLEELWQDGYEAEKVPRHSAVDVYGISRDKLLSITGYLRKLYDDFWVEATSKI